MLRLYRDTLASDIKTSVKITVLNMPLDSDSVSGEGIVDNDGGLTHISNIFVFRERLV